jgi:hypothetical protein
MCFAVRSYVNHFLVQFHQHGCGMGQPAITLVQRPYQDSCGRLVRQTIIVGVVS